ncbi:proline dehydrogenase family protein [Tessaracoccus caeni]|uniref:proline dehydrogenase family protein n=1 Tax=Tessaracoccus caeni TaxID=3031239 RepID=UPI0023DB8453|nr:proline dehydrogenase family protein [Tessaracoccus caeni]MDF1487745.1 hypothetical protein [Tessaracoccus caeni]
MTASERVVRRIVGAKRMQRAALLSGAVEEFASAYVGGDNAIDAARTARRLQGFGLLTGFAYLPSDDDVESLDRLAELLGELGDLARSSEINVKPHTLGRDAAARARLRQLCEGAEAVGAVVTLEMQGFSRYAETLRLWRDVREDHRDLGITVPAEIRRAEADCRELAMEAARVRLCVGAHPVPRAEGIHGEHQKARALVRCLRIVMETGGYAMLASHHPTVVAIAQELARRNGLGKDGFEFQMFHGIRPLEQRRLVDIGYRARTYVPFGPGWFEHLTTRVAVRPRTAYPYLQAVMDKR